MTHPLEGISPRQTGSVLIWVGGLTLAGAATLTLLGRSLQTDAAPSGMQSLQLARSLVSATAIIESWRVAGVGPRAAFVVGIDYLFIPLYVFVFSLGCIWATRQRPGSRLATFGILLAWLQIVAGALDALENVGLIRMIEGDTSSTWPVVIWACATAKFALVGTGLFYIASVHAFRQWEDAFPRVFGRPL